jgi:hypothetical protein
LLHDRLHHGLQLPLVVRLLRHGLAHDQLQRAFHRDLGVIGLYEPVGPLHHPRLGIREIVLSLFGRLRGLRRRARRRGFLAGARLQRPLRLTDPWVAFRADAAFAKPEIYEALETRGVPYAIRIPANKNLELAIEDVLFRSPGRPGLKPLVRYKSFHYQADSWTTARRVVAKVEHHVGELFPRVGFIVTNLPLPNRAVVRFYNKRGTAEQWIKEGKQAAHWTRLSCHRFRANEVRLQLSVLAYNLGNLWRRLVLPRRIDSWSLTSLQQRLVKTGGRLVKHARYYWLLLAESHLTQRLFGAMLQRIWALPVPTG